ncbi:MAG: hypothetical protein Q8M29_09935 [Bacteroidota bacterium]|nr:hypothetical protein [Bacteroidota bacterium]
MKKLLAISLLLFSLNGACQSFQKTFIREFVPNSNAKISCKYEFSLDSTFLYEQKNSSLVNGVSQQTIINSYTGTYKTYGDTIKLLSLNGEILEPSEEHCLIIDSILNGVMALSNTHKLTDYFYDESLWIIKGKWGEYNMIWGYYTEQIDCSKKDSSYDYKRIALVDLKYADTTYYCIPASNDKLKFNLSFYAKYFSVLNYLILIPFSEKGVSQRPCRCYDNDMYITHCLHGWSERMSTSPILGSQYDDNGRLIQYCLYGGFEMSSIPTVLGFEYYDNTDLIKSSAVSGPIEIDKKEYKTFKYDNEGRLIEFNIHYYEKGELTHSYKIIYL